MSLLSQLALLAILIKVKKTGILLVFIHPVAVSVSSLYCWLGPGEEVCRWLSTELSACSLLCHTGTCGLRSRDISYALSVVATTSNCPFFLVHTASGKDITTALPPTSVCPSGSISISRSEAATLPFAQ